MASPPVLTGAVKETDAEFGVVVTAITEVGAPGTVAGITDADETERLDAYTPLVALTLNV